MSWGVGTGWDDQHHHVNPEQGFVYKGCTCMCVWAYVSMGICVFGYMCVCVWTNMCIGVCII